MVESEFKILLSQIQARQCELQTLEIKAANKGCPERLYDTLSAFSNQDLGGTIVFGLDESQGFNPVGVYNAQDLQKKVMEYGEQMTPVIRPVFTVCEENGLCFVAAEIPPIDIVDRPCFKTAKGRVHGSYIRVGDADKPMTEYEVYSYEAFRKKYRDDIRPAKNIALEDLDANALQGYIALRKLARPNFSAVSSTAQLYDLLGITQSKEVTLSAVLLFSPYPQAYYPQLSIIATSLPGCESGILSAEGNRFLDSKRIEGTLPEMLDQAIAFVRSNMRTATRIDPATGQRKDQPDYPMDAVRETILNALIHRDYSFHTEGMPIQLILYSDRLEVINPGGLYGRLNVDQLGSVQPDTRNPVLVTAMETLGKTENRYSGIPRIRHAMSELGLPDPIFINTRNSFKVILYNKTHLNEEQIHPFTRSSTLDPKKLLEFCKTPRSRQEVIEYLGIASAQYALKKYLTPLISAGAIQLEDPDHPRSSKQKYRTVAQNKN